MLKLAAMNVFNSPAPFLAWAGGKRWLATRYNQIFPVKYRKYIEPFLGSGAVFFKLRPSVSILSDLNPELTVTYQAIRDNPDAVLKALRART
jgi:DNA adenine methylase